MPDLRVCVLRMAALLALLLLASAPVLAQVRIGVITMAPGEIFFERFGHNAIVVSDARTGQATSYNFGFFDMDEPDFATRFALGDMQYYLVALPLEEDLAYYRRVGRGVGLQWLDLPAQQANALAEALAVRARPGNARYAYDYFTNNCSTQVRDIIDAAMGGALRPQLDARSRGNTFRSEAVRLASPATWMWLGFDIGLGPYADVPLSRWGEAYVPMRLADSLREARNTAGQPLVVEEVQLLPHLAAPEPADEPRSWAPWLLAGLLAGVLIALASVRSGRVLGALLLPLWLVCGLVGLVLAFLWGFTEHQAAWANRNLLLFNPLCLLLVPASIALLRGRPIARWQSRLALAVLVAAGAAWFLHWLPMQVQYNHSWVALLLPVHAAVAHVLAARAPVPGDAGVAQSG